MAHVGGELGAHRRYGIRVNGPHPHGVVDAVGGDPRTVGLNATLYTSGYVECVYSGFGEGCRKRYDFVPYMDLPDGWFTKDGNSYCSEHWTMVRRRVTTSKEVRHKRKKGRK